MYLILLSGGGRIMATDDIVDIDTLRIIAALFWIAGGILTLIVAVRIYNQDRCDKTHC